jgi:hypothetical protein
VFVVPFMEFSDGFLSEQTVFAKQRDIYWICAVSAATLIEQTTHGRRHNALFAKQNRNCAVVALAPFITGAHIGWSVAFVAFLNHCDPCSIGDGFGAKLNAQRNRRILAARRTRDLIDKAR